MSLKALMARPISSSRPSVTRAVRSPAESSVSPRHVYQQGQGEQPERCCRQVVGQFDSPPHVPFAGHVHQFPRAGDLPAQAGDILKRSRIQPDLVAVAHQVVQTAALLRSDKRLLVLAFGESPNLFRPGGRFGRGEFLRVRFALLNARL